MVKHKSQQFWITHVAAAQASDMSKVAYCRQHGLDYKTLLRWIGRLRRRSEPAQSLVPVAVRDAGFGWTLGLWPSGPRGREVKTFLHGLRGAQRAGQRMER